VVASLPRTAGGKLKRHELAEKLGATQEGGGVVQAAYVEPATALQRELAKHWAIALGVERVGADDDFFALGGGSLKAASFVNRIESDYGEVLYVTSLFDAPTLARYEAFLRERHPALAARIDGVEAPAAPAWAVDDARLAAFRAAIAPTLRARAAPRERLRPAVFVLSPPRSGSTLLRAMLAGHPRLFAPPELYLLPFGTLAERRDWFAGAQRFQLEGLPRALMQLRGIDADAAAAAMARGEADGTTVAACYAELQDALGDRLLVDKTPYYASRPETLAHAEAMFRDARYLHLVRHPCAMIRSFDEASLGQLWYPRLVGPVAAAREACPWPSLPFAEMLWNVLHANIADFLDGVPAERQLRVAFEDLVRAPEATMRAVAGFLGLDYEPAMLEPQRDRQARMTDGLREQSRMIGDMKFHRHASIDAGVAERWRATLDESMLSAPTVARARTLGYAIDDPAEREVFVL
jgi:LPS sulfotransferase NodH